MSLRTQWPLPWQLTIWESMSDIILGERSKYWGEEGEWGEKDAVIIKLCTPVIIYMYMYNFVVIPLST